MDDKKKRGSIAFFTSFRSQVPLDIYSCPLTPNSDKDEVHMTDGVSYNYNGHDIPAAALKAILNRPKLINSVTKDVDIDVDVDLGRVSGMVFVSERSNNLETLHISLLFNDGNPAPNVKVFKFGDLYDDTDVFEGVRMEDRGCFAGDYIVYVSTRDDPREHDSSSRRQPWTAVYRTNLHNGNTDRLTPLGIADLSSSVSPSGKMIAVASFESKIGGWSGEVEDLKTNIFVMDVDEPSNRTLVIKDGGWPTWGSDNVLFFHRKVEKTPKDYKWRVFRADVRNGFTSSVFSMTPDDIYFAMTPAAINETTVAVAVIREGTHLSDINNKFGRDDARYYRHIEIFDSTGQNSRITEIVKPLADHYNPFVIVDKAGSPCIGYHRSTKHIKSGDVSKQFDQIQSPNDDVGVLRVSGVFPTFSKDGEKLAFVDRDFCKLWLADSNGLRIVYTAESSVNCFFPAWNKDPEKDTLYICVGHSFYDIHPLSDIIAVCNVSGGRGKHRKKLTESECSDAFPSSNPEGTKLVFRSTRDWLRRDHSLSELPKNLYIMEDVQVGEFFKGKITRLTEGEWIDTQCQWSPRGDWIVFSSNRDMPKFARTLDNNGLDLGYYAVYIVNVNHKDVVVRVVASGHDLAGRVSYPSFSPDQRSIVVTSDLAAVSVDPISLPLFLYNLRPYGDIFSIDIDPNDILKNKDLKKFHRITHSRYENATPTWTTFTTQRLTGDWKFRFKSTEDEEIIR